MENSHLNSPNIIPRYVFHMFSGQLISLTNPIHRIPGHFVNKPCRVGSVGSVSASRTVGREFASRPGHTKDHHKNGTNCLPA